MSTHTKEPWDATTHYSPGRIGESVLNTYDYMRAMARVNACADLDPQIVSDLIEAATRFPRCCDLWQDSLGGMACVPCQQKTFSTLKEIQQILGVNKVGVHDPQVKHDRAAWREVAARTRS